MLLITGKAILDVRDAWAADPTTAHLILLFGQCGRGLLEGHCGLWSARAGGD